MLNKIKAYGRRFISFVKTPKGAVLTGAGLLILFILFSKMGGDPLASYDIGEVIRKDIISIVDVTGRVKPSERVDIALERSGKVARINVAVGESVQKGTLILSAAGADLYASLAEAQANLEIEQLELEEASRTGSVDWSNAQDQLMDSIEDGFVKTDDAIRDKADQFFHNDGDFKRFGAELSADGSIFDFDASLYEKLDLSSARNKLTDILEDWRTSNENLDDTALETAASQAEQNLVTAQTFLNDLANVVNSYNSATSDYAVTISSYRTDLSSARTSVNTALSSLRSAEQSYLSTKAMTISEGSDLQEVLLQEQRVKNAEAQVNAVYAEIEKSSVRAPFDGIVTKIDAEMGETLSAGSPVVSMMSISQFEIETFVPEADIAGVALGNKAEVTLDAYDSDTVFGAYASFIDPAETMVEGVATYKVLLSFDEEDERILSGMTANVDIITDTRLNALSIPQRAVIEKDGQRYVRVISGEETKEVGVRTGLKGFDGDIEILEGLNEGDQIVVFTRG
ncbi:MAG: efflux RND transporter periplasmic adaptor subunit [Candidatus Colwellbacteria bacterium]|nr:efflux RND transporter periplasmic adaptor subunit [Candidatus Colwellbacteria bacterium]